MKNLLLFGLVSTIFVVGCPASVARPASNTPAQATREPSPPGTVPGDYAWLCSLSGGRYCPGCADPSGCPQEDSGPLCCVGTTCVEWSGSHCSGDLGWCFNYSTEVDPSGVTKATCHDQ